MRPIPHPLNRDFTWADRCVEPTMLTAHQIEDFDRDGYLLVRSVFDWDTIEQVRSAIDVWEAKAEQILRAQPGGTMSIATADEITFTVHLVTRCPEARQFALHRSLVGLCHDLIGDDVRLYWDQAVYKKPEPVREFPWHQDNGYAFVEPQQYLTCWVPLTEATLDNGCPWVVPGAHRFGTLEHVSSPAGLRCQVDTDEAVPVQARVGDVVAFSSLTPHRTGPNRTDRTRKAYIVQYAAEGAEVVDAAGLRVRQDRDDRQFRVLKGGQPVSG